MRCAKTARVWSTASRFPATASPKRHSSLAVRTFNFIRWSRCQLFWPRRGKRAASATTNSRYYRIGSATRMGGQSDRGCEMNVIDKYNARIDAANSMVCVGLDSDHRRLPERFAGSATPQFDFNRWVIDQTHEFASAYKPNMAFYEARGDAGLRDLKATIDYLHANHPDILTICDAKRADIGTTQ